MSNGAVGNDFEARLLSVELRTARAAESDAALLAEIRGCRADILETRRDFGHELARLYEAITAAKKETPP